VAAEPVQAVPDPGAAGQHGLLVVHPAQRLPQRAAAEHLGDHGQFHVEHRSLSVPDYFGQRMDEGQEQRRVRHHRRADAAQHGDPGPVPAAAGPLQEQQFLAEPRSRG
jgi:hypothetical protein